MKEAENMNNAETQALNIPVVIGSFVKFYDLVNFSSCNCSNKDRNLTSPSK
jgi:hypothetical protein